MGWRTITATSLMLVAAGTLGVAIVAGDPGLNGAVAINDNWLQTGKTFVYRASGTGVSTFEFDVVVHAVTSSTVTIDVVNEINATTIVDQASFSKTTRENVASPGVFSPLWVKQADVDRGWAILAGHNFTLAQDPLFHVFVDDASEYKFDKVGGYLFSVANADTGVSIDLIQQYVTTTLPTPSGPHAAIVVNEGAAAANGGALVVAPLRLPTLASTFKTIRLFCEDLDYHVPLNWILKIDGELGEQCQAIFDVESIVDMSYGPFRLEMPFLGVGKVVTRYSDPDGDVRIYVCTGTKPIIDQVGVVCEEDYPRGLPNDYRPGRNSLKTLSTWRVCGSVVDDWGCRYSWRVDVTGFVDCVSGPARCWQI